MRVIGLEEVKTALKAAYIISLVAPEYAHVLIFGPHGTAKTTLVEEFCSSLSLRYVKTQGTSDLLPSDFLASQTVKLENGVPRFIDELKAPRSLLDDEKPGVWYVDEIDKMPPKSTSAFLEPMARQAVTLNDGTVKKLRFFAVATANLTFDEHSNKLPLSVVDRFAIVLRTGYLSREEELQVLHAVVEGKKESERFEIPQDAAERFVRELRRAKDEAGPCFVDVVRKLREETGGALSPRAFIYATFVYAALRVLGYDEEQAKKAAVAWCIAPRLDRKNALDMAMQAFRRCPTCERRLEQAEQVHEGGEEADAGQAGKTQQGEGVGRQMERAAGRAGRVRFFPLSLASQVLSQACSGSSVLTAKGRLSPDVAGELLSQGKINEAVSSGLVFRAAGSLLAVFAMSAEAERALQSIPLPSNERKEIRIVSESDADYIALLAFLRDYGFRDLDDIAVMQPQDVGKMLLGESERKARGLRPRTKELRFLLDILGTALSAKVEEALVSDFDRTGEFWDDSHEEQYRIDVRRTTRNFVNMNYQVERKRFSKTGRRYVFCVDASGSMGGAVGKFTRIAVAGAVCAAVAEADPEATFSVAAFNTQGEVLLRRGRKEEAQSVLLSVAPDGGTDYTSGIRAALEVAEPGDALLVVGDFEDHKVVPEELKAAAREKGVSFYAVLAGDAHSSYAEYLAEQFGGKVLRLDRGVALER